MSNLNVTSINGQDADAGLAKAYAHTEKEGTGLKKSFNVSSVTDVSAGTQRISFTNEFSDNRYVPTATSRFTRIVSCGDTSLYPGSLELLATFANNNTLVDAPILVSIHGDLA